MINSLIDVPDRDYDGVYFEGTVVDNNDPDKLERVRISCPGLYEGSDTTMFPWARSIRRMMFGGGQHVGQFGVPIIGTTVSFILDQGDPHHPIYLGYSLKDGNQVTEAGTNYPNRYGFKDPNGNLFYIDMTTKTVHFTHGNSGMTIDIAADGSITVNTPARATITSTGDITFTSQGKVQITGQEVDITSQSKVQVSASSEIDLTAATDIDLNATRLNGNISGQSDFTAGGGTVALP